MQADFDKLETYLEELQPNEAIMVRFQTSETPQAATQRRVATTRFYTSRHRTPLPCLLCFCMDCPPTSALCPPSACCVGLCGSAAASAFRTSRPLGTDRTACKLHVSRPMMFSCARLGVARSSDRNCRNHSARVYAGTSRLKLADGELSMFPVSPSEPLSSRRFLEQPLSGIGVQVASSFSHMLNLHNLSENVVVAQNATEKNSSPVRSSFLLACALLLQYTVSLCRNGFIGTSLWRGSPPVHAA